VCPCLSVLAFLKRRSTASSSSTSSWQFFSIPRRVAFVVSLSRPADPAHTQTASWRQNFRVRALIDLNLAAADPRKTFSSLIGPYGPTRGRRQRIASQYHIACVIASSDGPSTSALPASSDPSSHYRPKTCHLDRIQFLRFAKMEYPNEQSSPEQKHRITLLGCLYCKGDGLEWRRGNKSWRCLGKATCIAFECKSQC